MAVFSIISRSQLEGAMRLDAEYYQPEYLEVDRAIQDFQTLEKLADKVFSGPFGSTLKSESYQEVGIPFVRIGDISDVFIEKDGLVRISESEHKRIHSTHLKQGDIVLSKIGTVGRLSVIPEELGEVNISENNIGLRLSKLSHNQKAFLLIFLLSRFGRSQLVRKSSGNIQLKLNVNDVESIKVPTAPPSMQENIGQMYDQTIEQRHLSSVLYAQAEHLLLKELGLEDFEEDGGLWSVVRLSDVQAANRMDAEYFQPKYQKVTDQIKRTKHAALGDISSLVGHAMQTPYDELGSVAVLAQKHMQSNLQIDIVGFDNFTKDDLIKKNDKKYILKQGDLLVSSAGKPGLTSVWIADRGMKVIPGSFVTVARLKNDIDPLYVGVFLNTIAGKLQFERDYTGSVQQYVYPSKIKNILVPILPQATQRQIADLVSQSHAARAKAKELLEKAKRMVEEWVERGG